MEDPSQNHQASEEQPSESLSEQPVNPALSPVVDERKFKITRQFILGFALWYVVMGLIFVGLVPPGKYTPNEAEEMILICNGLFFPLQVIVLIILFVTKNRREVGWGMLAAIGVNLVISLALGLVLNAVCFIPFFAPAN